MAWQIKMYLVIKGVSRTNVSYAESTGLGGGGAFEDMVALETMMQLDIS